VGGTAVIPDEAWVLRGGKRVAAIVDGAAQPVWSVVRNLIAVEGEYRQSGLCVTAGIADSPEALAIHAATLSPELMVTTVGELRAIHLDVVPEPGKPSPAALLLIPDEPTADTWSTLDSVLGLRPRVKNPKIADTKQVEK